MSLYEILIFLLKRKKYSIGIPFLAGILGFALAWILPPYYKSEIRVVLDTNSKTMGVSGVLKSFSSSALGDLSGANLSNFMNSGENEDLYLAIIDSRDLLLSTIEKFKLDTIYKSAKYKETLIKSFYKDIKINVDDLTGVISCSYEAKNRELARDVVRFVVEDANNRYVNLRKEKSLQALSYLKTIRDTTLKGADSISLALVEFYRKNNLFELKTQMELTLSALAGYEEQIKNFRISESRAGENSSAADLQKKRVILEKEFQKLRGAYSEGYTPPKNSIYINSDWAVEKLIEQEKLEINLKRFMSLLEMLEMQIVTEESNLIKNLPVIQIVQDAYLADYKSKPKRALWALGTAAFAFTIISIALILQGFLSGELAGEPKTRENLTNLIKAIKL